MIFWGDLIRGDPGSPWAIGGLKIGVVVGGELQRNVFPFGAADGAEVISVLNTVGNAAEVKRVGTFSGEDGLAFPSFQMSQANWACFLQNRGIFRK